MIYVFDTNSFRVLGNYYPDRFPSFWEMFDGLVAAAGARGGCVVTEEANTQNAAKIPNVCEHFGVDCTNVEGFMERESWTF